ncbi:MAG: arylsulfatase [Cyanobacteria bacterium SBLK]|nr:arylsulfatase [Cyanobacteria bacterium SBLK]
MKRVLKSGIALAISLLLLMSGMLPWLPTERAFAQTTPPPNILVIMGDDIGWTNLSAYEKGIVGYDTPNIDRIANEGMLFTDYYAEQSCTAGRGAFLTGQSALRTGLLKVGLPGTPYGLQDDDPTLAEMLKPLGYVTGQFGKNHLGDRNEFLPTVHGFDEFFGNLYHLNAEEEPENVDYPQNPAFRNNFGPRGVLDCVVSEDYSEEPIYDINGNPLEDKELRAIYLRRFSELGNQFCKDTGPLDIERMKDVDREFLDRTVEFIEDAVAEDKPFFTWFNSTRMHFYTHLNDNAPESGQDFYGDGMLEHDGHVGELLKLLDPPSADNPNGLDIADNTIVIYTTDNGPHYNEWPDGGLTPFRGEKNTNWEGGYRVPGLVRWTGHIPAGTVSHEIFSHLDWVPTLMAAAGVDTLKEDLLGPCPPINPPTNLCATHLDGYNQLPYLLDPENEEGQRHEFFYFSDEGTLPGMRYDDWKFVYAEQRAHGFDVWREPFVKLRAPKLFNLRRDPYERADTDSNNYERWWVQRAYLTTTSGAAVEQFLDTFEDYPPSQPPFHFDYDAAIKEITDKIGTKNSAPKGFQNRMLQAID